jgi:hypothetical protein
MEDKNKKICKTIFLALSCVVFYCAMFADEIWYKTIIGACFTGYFFMQIHKDIWR